MQMAVVSVLAKTLCGGVLVLGFAALSQALKPKRFAGILGAAPSVAIAGIVDGSLAKGPLDQAAAARSMIAGAVALTVCAAVLVPASRRWAAGRASMAACAAWIVVALVLYPVVA